MDYERFAIEVLKPLRSGEAFSYRPYDCSTGSFCQPVAVQPGRLCIIEGSYSLHPFFGDPYDLNLVLTVSAEDQRQRILQRPAFLHQRFFDLWIPMENAYLQQLFASRRKLHVL